MKANGGTPAELGKEASKTVRSLWASTMVDGFGSLPREFQARVPATS